jgi:hypothetical protein
MQGEDLDWVDLRAAAGSMGFAVLLDRAAGAAGSG